MTERVVSEAFEPDWAIPPGATIAAVLSARSLSRESLAASLGESIETVQRLLLGLEALSEDLAERLSRYLGSSKVFWITREAQFRADSERLRQYEAAVEQLTWVKQFPTREMEALGWIGGFGSLAESATECLKLFGVPDVAAWQDQYSGTTAAVAFRIFSSSNTKPGAVMAWLRWAELVAARIPCANWNAATFGENLQAARRLTWQKDPATFLPLLQRLCSDSGVALVVARTPQGCPASGATRFLSPTKAMMVLSFRYRSDDQFWFTFFHEAGHLILHGLDAFFVEDETDTPSTEEFEANQFAETTMIPATYLVELQDLRPNKDAVLRFARRVGVAPGLIVGQLQHRDRIAHDRLNWLKRRYDWDRIPADRLIP